VDDSVNGIDDDRKRSEPTPAVRRRTSILDGRRTWGALEVSPTRHGVTRFRLTVFPPGIDPADRRLLRAWRGWPSWGAVLWLLTQVLLGGSTTPAVAFGLATALYLGIGAVLFARVASVRGQVRGLCVLRIAGYADPRAAASYAQLCSLAAALDDIDARLHQGALTAVEHEAAWWHLYDQLGDQLDPDGPAAPTGRAAR
jgi:hypothetical protein